MSFRLGSHTSVGLVHLYVSNMERSLAFYRDVLKFHVIEEEGSVAVLGNENRTPLFRIEEKKGVLPKQRNRTGLYHFAILVSNREQLASVLRHVLQKGYPIRGGADHHFSEAIYMSDPDGNGLEIYYDRPKEVWHDKNGNLPFVSNPFDGEALLQEAKEWQGFSAETTVGHIHLHVGDLEEAKRFYVDGLGFEVTIPARNGALFVAAGGYHHHIGLNTWQGEGVPPQLPNSIGLKCFTLVLENLEQKEAVYSRLQSAGVTPVYKEGILQVEDPFGHIIHIVEKREA